MVIDIKSWQIKIETHRNGIRDRNKDNSEVDLEIDMGTEIGKKHSERCTEIKGEIPS